MADRISALEGHVQSGHFGRDNAHGVSLQIIADLQLHQVAAWAETLQTVGELTAAQIGADTAPAPGKAVGDAEAAMLRIEPLKWWLIGQAAQPLNAEQGATLDLSHSRTCVRISGENAVELLSRLLPLDLREEQFPAGSVASSAMHHVGVTLWRNEQGYDLFIPRGFAVSLWEVILQSALQFGVDVS